MTKTALLYERTVPVSTAAHGEWSLDSGGFLYARNSHFFPITTPEFEKAAWHYPIVFVQDAQTVVPCVITSYAAGENLFVDAEGNWDADYIPAFVRRYPFIFAAVEKREAVTLCIDDSYGGFNQEDRGERLFLLGGGRTSFLERTLGFLQHYQTEQERSGKLAQRLAELGLLEPVQAQVSLESGEQLSLGGFSTVNRERLRALDSAQLTELAQNDWLELLYIHLFSLGNFARLMDRHAARRQSTSVDAPT